MKDNLEQTAAVSTSDSPAGQCKIDINDGRRIVTAPPGQSLYHTLVGRNVNLPSVCGGEGKCGLCRVKIADCDSPFTQAETARLSEQQRNDGLRLACQVQVNGDLKIYIPDDLLKASQYHCECVATEDLNYDTKLFRFALRNPASISFIPGRYIQLHCPQYAENIEPIQRAYTIASGPAEKKFIELIIRRVPHGICTTYCFEHLKVGDSVTIDGPHGDFGLSNTDAPMVFIAGSSGIAPFISMLHQMRNKKSGRRAILFFGGNQVRDLFLLDKIKDFEQSLDNFKFAPVVAKPADNETWTGEKGLVTEAVQREFKDLSGYEGYLCGSPGMIDASIKVLVSLGIAEDKIYYDKFA